MLYEHLDFRVTKHRSYIHTLMQYLSMNHHGLVHLAVTCGSTSSFTSRWDPKWIYLQKFDYMVIVQKCFWSKKSGKFLKKWFGVVGGGNVAAGSRVAVGAADGLPRGGV